MSRPTIRDFLPEDQPRVRALVLEGLRERWGEAFEAARNPDLDDIAAHYVDRGADVVIVETAGAIVATGTLIPETRHRGRIVRMSVAGDRRRQGFGRRVVAELVTRARERGMTELVVLTDTPWRSAVALYLSCGFEEVGRDETDTHFAMPL